MKIFFKLNLLILLTSAFLGFSSCANGSGGGGGGGGGTTLSTGSFSMRLPSSDGRAVYTQSDAKFYEVILSSKSSSYTNSKTGEPGSTIEFTNLPVGTYTVRVFAYKSKAKSILVADSKAVDVDITAGNTSKVEITMIPQENKEGSGGGGDSPSAPSTPDNPTNPFEGYTTVTSWAALCQLVNDYSDKDEQLCVLLKSGGEMTQTLTVQGNVLIQTDTNVTLTRPTTLKDSLIKVTTDASLKLGGAGGGMLTIDGNKSNATATSSMIVVESGTLEIANNCTLQNAKLSPAAGATYNGGAAIYMSSGRLTLSGGFITGNECNKNGGAIYLSGAECTLTGTEITGNTTTINSGGTSGGGAIYMTTTPVSLTMTGGKITGNSAAANGGGVLVNFGEFNFNGGTISGNTKGNGNTYSGNQVAVGPTASFKINDTPQNSLEDDTVLSD